MVTDGDIAREWLDPRKWGCGKRAFLAVLVVAGTAAAGVVVAGRRIMDAVL